ncbi:mitochondrial resolvase Ydc2 [Chaetomium strumarium]|uniref:Mitochondrial resolvase Ydc2 n=1 Tax=Chaetomium strumarium TaxID=1170767 RepID=A0AAJ0M062_9PEZI|nr:mitochondrial resolvase Ydc2 [Chaetomium strumarium]
MTNVPLLKHSAASLQALCASCGLKKSGTKAALVLRLSLAAKHFQPLPPNTRVLSIDLGLKNFAFSLLSPAPASTPAPAPAPPRAPTPSSPLLNISPVHLHAWHRLDLTLPPSSTPDEQGGEAAEKDNEKEEEGGGDGFSPATLSAVTVDLVKSHLLPLQPTHVLIERQRFRTGGAAAIFEWTLRVNTLEAMLHAVFAALRGAAPAGDGLPNGMPLVVDSVLPRRVAGFLFPDGLLPVPVPEPEVAGVGSLTGAGEGKRKGKGKGRGGNGAYQLLKKGKVDVLGAGLKEGQLVVPQTEQAREMVGLFLEGLAARGQRKRGRKSKEEKDAVDEILTKMDDLSDAVLQGAVWLQWQRNLERLVKERPELLETTEM